MFIPGTLSALMLNTLDEPHFGRGLSDNWVGDIITHKNAVWLATGRGVSFSYFDESGWNRYDTSNGLVSQDISAMYSSGNVIWLALNHYEADYLYAFADGMAYSSDEGLTWDTMMVPNTYGYQCTLWDIVGIDSLMFCASWAGGLIASFDGGSNWRNIYATLLDSVYPTQYSNLHFAAAIDSLHGDSLLLWTGTAAGIKRFIFAPAREKLTSHRIYDIAAADSFIYIAGDSGITRIKFFEDEGSLTNRVSRTSFIDDGLPGAAVASVHVFGGRVFAGTLDSAGGVGTGLAVSDNDGEDFLTGFTGLDDVIGENKYPAEFSSARSFLFMAAREAGLYMSADTGETWQKIYTDPADTTAANGRNTVNSVAADSATLWVGTDSGVVRIEFDDLGEVVSRENHTFVDSDSSGGQVYRIAVQTILDSLGEVDSKVVWTLNHPLDPVEGINSVHYAVDDGSGWGTPQNLSGFPTGSPQYDIGFDNAVIFIVGRDRFTQSPNRAFWYSMDGNNIKDSTTQTINFDNQDFRSLLIWNDTIYIGADSGYGVSYPGSAVLRWHLIKPNNDPTRFDKVTYYTYPSDNISGNFVNVLAVQPLADGKSRVWASTHPTDSGYNAICYGTLDGLEWHIPIADVNCWNFDFNGPEVFAATSQGLLYSADTGVTWQEIMISGDLVTGDNTIAYTIDPAAEVLAARVIGDTLWVGTAEGAARIALDQFGTNNWEIYRVYDSSSVVYAFPVPYSYADSRQTQIKFHYNVPSAGNVTVEVYDFAMNLVKRVTDNEYKTAGIKENEDVWNGVNEDGHYVATGIYYFKITLPSGEERWGKLAIIP